MLRPRKSIESLFALLALNNQIQNFTPTPNQDFESRDFSYFETIIFRDQDSRSRLEVQVRGETETRLSKMCLEIQDRSRELHHYCEHRIQKGVTIQCSRLEKAFGSLLQLVKQTR